MNENSTSVAVREDRAVAVPHRFTREQVELIKRTVAKGATDDELQLFLARSERMGLDPFTGQIYFVKRGDKGTIQVGIDGYRLTADRTGDYAGNDDPDFEYDDDVNRPKLARVTIWKLVRHQRCPFTATARWAEYVPNEKLDHMWRKMPHTMLAKCAEALALRKAFPAELSGTYVKEEMDQADAPEPASAIAQVFDAQPEPARKPQVLGPTRPRSEPAAPKSPTQPLPGTVDCENCGKPITGQKLTVKGVERFVNAKTIQETIFERTGLTLCWPCYEAAKDSNVVAGQVEGSEAVAEEGKDF